MNTKERVVRLAATAAIVGSGAFFSACGSNILTNYSETKTPTLSQELPNISWDNLPAGERLQKLATKDYPLLLNFDRQKETILATAQEFARLTNTSSDDLIKSVKFLNGNDFAAEISRELSVTFTDKEIEREKQSRLAITTSKGDIFINQDLADQVAKDMRSFEESNDYSPKTILEISTLVHEFIHKTKKAHSQPFKGFSLRMPNNPNLINFNALNGFKIEGKDSQEKKVYLLGGDEATTDLAANIMVEQMGFVYSSTPEYKNGAMLVQSLNQTANVSDNEFLKFVLGEKDQAQLLEKWGSHRVAGLIGDSNLKTGVLTLAEIALATQGIIKFQEVEKDIRENFRQ